MSQEINPIELPAHLRALERQLAAIAPAPAALDRDQLMFHAGQAAATRTTRTRLRLWQGATATLLLASVSLGLAALQKPQELPPTPANAAIENQKSKIKNPPAPQVAPGLDTTSVLATNTGSPPAHPNPFSIDARMSWVTNLSRMGGGGGGGGKTVPTLRPTDGLDALPTWQQKALTNRS